MKLKLYYAKKELNEEDIECIEFNGHVNRNRYIFDKIHDSSRGTVFLLCIEFSNTSSAIFVFEHYFEIEFLQKYLYRWGNFSLHEYRSYEEAYKVALAMKEISPLCYEPDDQDHKISHIEIKL